MRSFPVTIAASGLCFEASEDETVMQAAARAGWPMVSSCRSGSCRTCMRQLASGRVSYRMAWPGLTPDEKADGWILPCVAYAAEPLTIAGEAQRGWWEKD